MGVLVLRPFLVSRGGAMTGPDENQLLREKILELETKLGKSFSDLEKKTLQFEKSVLKLDKETLKLERKNFQLEQKIAVLLARIADFERHPTTTVAEIMSHAAEQLKQAKKLSRKSHVGS
jgi:hypothetical protein